MYMYLTFSAVPRVSTILLKLTKDMIPSHMEAQSQFATMNTEYIDQWTVFITAPFEFYLV